MRSSCRRTREFGEIVQYSAGTAGSGLNRHRAELRIGAHRNRELQGEWNEIGEDGFVFEVLDTLPASDEPGYDVKGELRVLEELWLERLQPYGERGYNIPPK